MGRSSDRRHNIVSASSLNEANCVNKSWSLFKNTFALRCHLMDTNYSSHMQNWVYLLHVLVLLLSLIPVLPKHLHAFGFTVGPKSNWLLPVKHKSLIWPQSTDIEPFVPTSFYLTLGLYSLRRRRLISIGIPIINLRRSSDRLRFIMGIPIPVRQRLLSE